MTRPLLAIAAAVASLGFLLWGFERGMATLIGVLLAVANWFALRWLVSRLVDSDAALPARRAGLALLLVGKIGLFMAVVFVLIARVRVDPIGLALGLGVLFLGPALAGLIAQLDPSSARHAREER